MKKKISAFLAAALMLSMVTASAFATTAPSATQNAGDANKNETVSTDANTLKDVVATYTVSKAGSVTLSGLTPGSKVDIKMFVNGKWETVVSGVTVDANGNVTVEVKNEGTLAITKAAATGTTTGTTSTSKPGTSPKTGETNTSAAAAAAVMATVAAAAFVAAKKKA